MGHGLMATLRTRLERPTVGTHPATAVRPRTHRTGPSPRPFRTPRSRPALLFPAVLVVLVAVGAGLRLWGLGAHRLGFDESFTAMAGRKPFGSLLTYLRARDSHPPLSYLLRAPLARSGADELLFRLPSAAVSIGALGLFAWWVRNRGLAALVATGLVAGSAFQLVHGREGRMYAELELVGVVAAVLAESWLRRPRSWHAPAIGMLALFGLLTHVSMLLLAAGLLTLAGRRTDREAWRWRAALGAAVLGWAVLWGPSFLVQSRGGHSSWIPRTSLSRIVDVFGGLVAPQPALRLFALAGISAGATLLWRSDRRLGRVFTGCVVIPAALAAVAGLVAPVMLDRTLTLFAWGPPLALGYLLAGVSHRSRFVGAVAITLVAGLTISIAVDTVTTPSNVDRALRHVEHVARRGDVVASHPGSRLHLLLWSVAVRHQRRSRSIPIVGVGNTRGAVLGTTPLTGRTWLLVSTRLPAASKLHRCARDWSAGPLHVLCLQGLGATNTGGALRGSAVPVGTARHEP